MSSPPADDGETDGAHAPPTVDPSSGDPLLHQDGARRSSSDRRAACLMSHHSYFIVTDIS
jgi:hypothetical protein